MKRKWRVMLKVLACLLGLLAVGFIVLKGFCSYKVDHYALRCIKCLKPGRLRKESVYGICISSELTPVEQQSGRYLEGASVYILKSASQLYGTIHKHDCDHVWKKGGWHQSSPYGFLTCSQWTADGRDLGQELYAVRMRSISQIFELLKRFGDRGLARRSYRILDRIWPPGIVEEEEKDLWGDADYLWQLWAFPLAGKEAEKETEGFKTARALIGDEGLSLRALKLYFLARALKLIDNRREWRETVDLFESGPGVLELRNHVSELAKRRKQSEDKSKRRAASVTLRQLDQLDALRGHLGSRK